MLQHVAHLLGLRQQVHRVHHQAGIEAAQQQPQGLQSVGQHEADGVARLQAQVLPSRLQVLAALQQIAEAQLLRAVGRQCVDGLGPVGRLLRDQAMHRARHHDLPQAAKKRPKMASSVGTCSGIGRDTRVMFR